MNQTFPASLFSFRTMTSSTTPSSSVADAHSTPTTTTTAGNYENYIDDYLKNNNNNNSDDDDNLSNNDDGLQTELLKLLGPVRDPLGTVIPMSMLYVILLFTGIIGNVCTCIVIARNRYMHTATNFYLFSLAISDLLLLILGLPQELFMLWQKYPYVFGEFICVVRGLSSETSTNASILTITSFTIERYVAICHPLKSHTMSQLPRAIKIILVIWAVSAFCALPVAWQFGIIFLINKSSSTSLRNISRQCGIKNVYFEYGFETAAIVFFLMPITLITVLYVLIGINLRKSARQISKQQEDPKKKFRPRAKSTTSTAQTSSRMKPITTMTMTEPSRTGMKTSTKAIQNNNDDVKNNGIGFKFRMISSKKTQTLPPVSHQTQQQQQQQRNSYHHSPNTTIVRENQRDLIKHDHQNLSKQKSDNLNDADYGNLYQRNNSVSSSHQKQIASRRSVIRMLVAVVIAFFFCYSPFHAQRVLATTMHRNKLKSPTIHYVYVILTHISGVTYYLSATINPILYQLMSRKFRIAFKDTFGFCSPCLQNDLPEISYLNMIGGVNTNQLSRVPSFNSNYSFRRSSFNEPNGPTNRSIIEKDLHIAHDDQIGSTLPSPTTSLRFDLSAIDAEDNSHPRQHQQHRHRLQSIDQQEDRIDIEPDEDNPLQPYLHAPNESHNIITNNNNNSSNSNRGHKFRQFLDVPSVRMM
ncbi:Neuromedin-U receptor 2 [Sarcoptes scabiei]|uniref:Neuromedin-U receptor 2 n=1 Tax=Sarcoptes scabiei TaxID=52283 RepID=A0A834RBL4_SARSC|nr:Neuromedin-U receptor 2 [Sarcoptes scabiei]